MRGYSADTAHTTIDPVWTAQSSFDQKHVKGIYDVLGRWPLRTLPGKRSEDPAYMPA